MHASHGREFSCRLLVAEGFSRHDISDFEDLLLAASSVDTFINEIGHSGALFNMLGAEKVAIFWDMYKMF